MSIAWSQSLATNIPIIDSQHREMLDGLARFVSAVEQGHETERLHELLDSVSEHAESNFACEEEYMMAWDYLDYDAHEFQHGLFRKCMERIKMDIKIGVPEERLTEDVRLLLVKWLVDHMEVQDKRMGIWLGAVLVREARKEASPVIT